ncbi:hypothetical protein JXA84_07270 [candidate division WOR-3 bacterium]|nr:hypothetical protein [candidate division WOR-3 bacterium]
MFDDSDIPFNDKDLKSSDSVKVDQALKCPDCGSFLRYIEPYDRYWCDTCAKYMEPEFGKEAESEIIEEISETAVEESPVEEITVPLETEHKLKCPVCNYELQYFEEYDRYWCDMCAEFMPVNFGKPVESSSDTDSEMEEENVSVPESVQLKETPSDKPEERTCPVCKSPLRYIDEYKKWWCDVCLEYASEKEESYPSVSKEIAEEKAEVSEKNCPKCGAPLRRIEEYGRYWCDKCLEYVGLESEISTEKKAEILEHKIEIIPESIEKPTSDEPVKLAFDQVEEAEVIETGRVEDTIDAQEPVEEETATVVQDLDQQVSYVQKDLTQDFVKTVVAPSEDDTDVEEQLVLRCPKCKEEVRYIAQYDRFWCDNCGEYMPVGFKGSPVTVGDEPDKTDVSREEETASAVSDEIIQSKEKAVDLGTISLTEEQLSVPLEEETVAPMPESENLTSEQEATSEALDVSQRVEDFKRSETADLDLEFENEEVENLDEAEQISVVGAGESEGVALICPKCNKNTRYIEQYDRYWCDTCGEYMPVGFGKKQDTAPEEAINIKEIEIVSPQEEDEEILEAAVEQVSTEDEGLKCAFCGKKVRFIEQYQRYWCDNCEKYMPLDFGLEKIEVVPPSKPIVEEKPLSKNEENAVLCPKCGGNTTYVSKYNKYWCENCSEYVQPIYAKEPDIDKSTSKTCPDCGEKLVKCEPCRHWWCPVCDKCYPERIFS